MEVKPEQSETKPAGGEAPQAEEGKTLSKKAQNKLKKQQKKEEAKKAREVKKSQEEEEKLSTEIDTCEGKYGDLPLNQSQCDPSIRLTKKYNKISELTGSEVGSEFRVRGRLQSTRVTGKRAFLVLRQQFYTIQCIMSKGENSISSHIIKFAKGISAESIVEIVGTLTLSAEPIKSCSQSDVEIQIKELWCVNRSANVLPFQMEDATRVVLNQNEEETKKEEGPSESEEKKEEGKGSRVLQKTRLDNRIIDLRVPTNLALMKIQAAVARYFRQFLYENEFIEIHSPKIIAGTSEGGCEVFRLEYFGKQACLAQSPQLYKQMAICGDFERVFEIAPAFRAEDSNTNRHLCEFTMLDVEMSFKDHYFEALDMFGNLFNYIFKSLHEKNQKELEIVNGQYPFTPFEFTEEVVKLSFKEGIKLLEEAKVEQDPLKDLSTEAERALGEIVKEKYHTDFFMLYNYPVAARPFYTMLDPEDVNYTNSYDFFMRGEEITSGAQRIHDPKMLEERATAHNIPIPSIKDYITSFSYGVPPHAGIGVGLERVVKLFCSISNIRKCIFMTRDPKRLTP
jgi:aspartyl-tRNA synthetase